MSVDIYNKGAEILTTKATLDAPQIYSDADLDRIDVKPSATSEYDLKGMSPVSSADYKRSKMDYHIYSGENLLISKINMPFDDSEIDSNSDTLTDLQISVCPEKDIRTATNFTKGSFSIVYNFLTQLTDNLKIEEISADGTEIQLTLDKQKNQFIDTHEGLFEIFSVGGFTEEGKMVERPSEQDPASDYLEQYVLDFGDNELAAVTNFDFTLNERIGAVESTLKFPEDTFNGLSTRFYPISSLPGFWAEVYTENETVTVSPSEDIEGEIDALPSDSQPAESAIVLESEVVISDETKEVPTVDDDGNETGSTTTTEQVATFSPKEDKPDGKAPTYQSRFKNKSSQNVVLSTEIRRKFTTTGRGAKFEVATDEDLNTFWTQIEGPVVQTDGSIETGPVYYTFANDDDERSFAIGPDVDFFDLLNGKPTSSKVQYYNPQFAGIKDLKTVTVKLYKPLRGDLQTKSCTINRVFRDSYVEKIILYPYTRKPVQENFSEPNFKIDMGTYGKSVGTDLKSWNQLLDTNLQTSQQIIDKYISASFEEHINLNYSDFSEFVHYSSAVERVNNFKYKLELIEGYDDRIKTLRSVSGSEALTNISQSITRKNTVVSGMDGFERWMYTEPSSSLYSHYSGSNFTFQPWPKVKSQPPQLISATSSNAIHYYNNLIESASYFDAMNTGRLTKTIPASIAEDPLNLDYIMFIDMIGHHFDITWAYIKKLTSINVREEHPYDGMPNNLLYDVAKSMGWKLTHGKDREELWSYALGTDKFGNPVQSGSLASKPVEQYTHEIWRRIVNNIPYLLKTKGSARAVKALIATYGIPQTFLSIREYGGPVIEDERQFWEHERFVYHQRFDTDNYMTVPFDKITDIDPVTYAINDPNPIDVIELQVQQNMNRDTAIFNKGDKFAVVYESLSNSKSNIKGNIHFYLTGSSGYKSASISNVPIFDSKMSTLIVQRQTSVDDITQDNEYRLMYRKHRRDNIILSKSASIFITGSSEPSYNAAWTGSGTLTVGKTLPTGSTPSLWADAQYLSGSIQELRYWAQPLKDIVIDEHTLARESYHGNSPTASYFDLKFRFLPDSRLNNVQAIDSQPSQHPNQQISKVLDGRILSASLYNFEPDDLRGVTDEYHTKVPSAGANNIMNNKIRLEPNRLKGVLDTDQRKETSKYDSAPNDSNQLGVYLSATKMFNEDIYNHTGFFDIDDYIGDPDQREGFTEQNEQLDYLRRQVFKKYSTKNLINSTIDILARYDFSVFEQIRQTIPARVDYNSGIIIEPHILERPKVKSKAKLTKTEPFYKTVIKQIDKVPQMFITPLEVSMSARPEQEWTYPTYETEISGGAAPKISMTTTPLSMSLGSIAPTPSMTYPTYDNFKSDNIPMMTASFGAEYVTHQTQLFLTQSQQGSGEYPTYGTDLDLTSSLALSGDYKDYTTNIVIEQQRSASADYTNTPDILLSTPNSVTAVNTLYSATLLVSHSISVTKKDLEDKGLITAKIPYKPSQYKFDILIPSASGDVGFGLGWITGSNGSWNYNALGTTIVNKRPAKYARSINYFYSSSLSASLGLSYSSSLSPSQVSTDELPLAVFNLRHLGCKMTSDSLTTNSPDTPDGKPVIEVFQADPNVLINTSQTAEEGNLDVDVLTGLTTLNIEELFISKEVFYQRRMEYRKEKSKFRREIQKLINIEESRRNEFDVRKQNSEDISNREKARQDEFDVINNPEIVKKEIEEKEKPQIEVKEEREVRLIDGQQVNVESKQNIEPEKFGGLAEKISKLPPKEREIFIEEKKIDKKIIEQLELPKKESKEKVKKEGKSERRGE